MNKSKISGHRFRLAMVSLITLFCLYANGSFGQQLRLNDLEYFEKPGLNVLVFSNQYNGMFFDEKTAGIEIIHHGVRTSTGGAVRLQNTPEQWDLIPIMVERKVNKDKSIDVVLRYEDFDFNSRVNVAAKGNGLEINVYLDKAIPEIFQGIPPQIPGLNPSAKK
ncbi:MAG: hypothetical protein Q8P34_13845 [Bacteroidota bacterium]|nr:hypothetical protein [Bacteroidota bacterium]